MIAGIEACLNGIQNIIEACLNKVQSNFNAHQEEVLNILDRILAAVATIRSACCVADISPTGASAGRTLN